jgi:hypothetical protein
VLFTGSAPFPGSSSHLSRWSEFWGPLQIWTDNYNQVPSGGTVDTVTFDGASYDVHKSGSYIAFVATNNVTSGTLNLLSFFNYVIGKGWIASTSTLGAIDYGIELVSTGGADATFEVNDFSLTTN